MSKFYFVRHGQSEANATDRVSDDAVKLTKLGVEQARAASSKLKEKDIELILVSPLIRAQQTAEIIAKEINYTEEILILDMLTERNLGSFKKQQRPENKNYFYEIDEGNDVETRNELITRATNVFEEIKQCADKTDGNILIVGHAIVGFFMRQIAAGNSNYDEFDWSLKIKNSEVVEVIYD